MMVAGGCWRQVSGRAPGSCPRRALLGVACLVFVTALSACSGGSVHGSAIGSGSLGRLSSGPGPSGPVASPAETKGPSPSATPRVTVPPRGGGSPAPGRPGVALGVFVWPGAAGDVYASIDDFVGRLGRTPAIIQTFQDWRSSGGAPMVFPARFAGFVAAKGATVMVTWQPGRAGAGVGQPDFSWAQLASSRYDGYLRAWADAAKAFGHVVYVRLMHEMNIPVYPWSFGVNGNTDPRGYLAAWAHITGVFRAEGASNVQFVWCAAAGGPGSTPGVGFLPGDGLLSWVSLDGYNRLAGVAWRSFADIFASAYRSLVAVSHRPVMIAETASVEEPGNASAKAVWIAQAFGQVTSAFPRVRAVLYFDAPGRGFSYPLTSSSAAFDAFRAVADTRTFQAAAPATTLTIG